MLIALSKCTREKEDLYGPTGLAPFCRSRRNLNTRGVLENQNTQEVFRLNAS